MFFAKTSLLMVNVSGQVLPLIPPDNTPIVDACFYQDRLVLVSQGGTAYSLDTEVLQDTSRSCHERI